MDDPSERERILDQHDPDVLFGVTTDDPRALRRAYARLAKRWRDDAEVSAHLRRRFEATRDGETAHHDEESPPPTPDALPDTVPELAARFAQERITWLRHDPERLAEAVVRLGSAANTLGPDTLDLLEGSIEDPTWDLPPNLHYQLLQRVWLARALGRADREGELPAAVRTTLRDAPSLPDDELARRWASMAEVLPTDRQALHHLLADLEEDHPALFAEWVRVEERLRENAQPPADLPDLQELRDQSRTEPYKAHFERIHGWIVRRWVGAPVNIALYFLLRPRLDNRFWSVVLAIILGRIVLVLVSTLAAFVTTFVQGSPDGPELDRLEATAREHGLFPRELAALVSSAPERPEPFAHPAHHSLVALDHDPGMLVRVLGPAHLARFGAQP